MCKALVLNGCRCKEKQTPPHLRTASQKYGHFKAYAQRKLLASCVKPIFVLYDSRCDERLTPPFSSESCPLLNNLKSFQKFRFHLYYLQTLFNLIGSESTYHVEIVQHNGEEHSSMVTTFFLLL